MAITENTYTGDGVTVLFPFTFPYLQEADIKITLSGTPTTAYTLANPTTIQFNTAPSNGVAIRIYRDTDTDTLSAEFFPGSAIRAEDLNNNYTQNNYAVQEAKRESDAAVTTSNSTLNIVSSFVTYDPIINVAAIPAAPSDGDRIEVFDSTGIESYTPLSGVPVGFIGASTLTVRLVYSVTTWVWQDYQSTDPDGRYLKLNGDSTMTGNLVMGTNSITGLVDPTSAQDAATKKYVDDNSINNVVEDITPQLGGQLDALNNKIVNLDDPTSAQDAATKNYVDSENSTQDGVIAGKLALTGGTMSGNIAMGSNSVTGLSDPSNPQDAATKNYVDTNYLSQSNATSTYMPLAGGTFTGDVTIAGNLTASGINYPSDGALSGTRNRIINGDMRIAQRGTAASTANASYPVDRWIQGYTTSGAVSAQYETASTPTGFQAAIKFTTTTADATTDATDFWNTQQIIEGFNSADLLFGTANAQDVTVSFWVRSSVTGTFCMTLLGSSDGTTIDRSYVSEYTISSADTWEYKTIIVPGDTGGTWTTTNGRGLLVRFGLTAGTNFQQAAGSWGTLNALGSSNQTQLLETLNATWYVTGVQLEAGTVATPFERRSYGQELALCQRYYMKTYDQSVVPGASDSAGAGVFICNSNGTGLGNIVFPVEMRSAPSCTAYSTTGTAGYWIDGSGNNRVVSVSNIGTRQCRVVTSTATASSSMTGQLVASAEL